MIKRNLFFLFSATSFAIASTVLDVFNYNPYVASKNVFINFYFSLFIACAGVLAMILFYIKYKGHKNSAINSLFWPSVRQGLFLSVSLILLLILKVLSLLDIWIGISLVAVIILLELFFQTKKSKPVAA